MPDPYKCLGAVHIPLRKDKRTDDDWFERVDALAADVKSMVERACANERAKVLRLLLDECAEHPGAPGWVASWAAETAKL